MKYCKYISLLLALLMMFTLTACDNNNKPENTGEPENPNLVTIDQFEALYNSCEITKDSEENDALVITMTFANNSEAAESFEWAFYYEIVQKDTPLDHAIVWEDIESFAYVGETNDEEVEPGKSREVRIAYKITDLSAPVTMTFHSFLSDDTDTLIIDPSTAVKTEPSQTTAAIPASTTAAPEGSESSDVDWWLGDWYGWWTIFNGEGETYEELINEAWDCCMYIEPYEDDVYILSIWDEDYNDYRDNCLAEVYVTFNPDEGGVHGVMDSCENDKNYFWNGTVGDGDWSIDPDATGFENMLIIEGSFTDKQEEKCEYGIVLTKWGEEWNPESTFAPDYYDSYFLPLMKSGEALPARFEPDAADAPDTAPSDNPPAAGSSADMAVGRYNGTVAYIMEEEHPLSEIYQGENYIELQENGNAKFCLDNDLVSAAWTLDGEELIITVDSMDCPSTLKDGEIVMDFAGTGMLLTFVKE